MQTAWPRNIVPYTADKLRALSTVESVVLYEDALDHPLFERDLTDAQRKLADELVAVGLLTRHGDHLRPTNRHMREPEHDIPGVAEHKRAVVGYTQTIIADTINALAKRGARAQGAVGVVTMPETPETIARAMAIMAEAEDQLRALAEEQKEEVAPGGAQMRVLVFIGSRAEP